MRLPCILLLALLILGQPSGQLRFCVTDVVSNKEMVTVPVAIGDQVEVEYTHSMYGVPQKEFFSIDNLGRFRLEKVVFGSIAAVLYYDPDPGQDLNYKDGKWVLKGNNQIFEVLKYRVSPGTGHLLKVRHRTIDLSGETAESGRLIQLSLKRISPT